MSQQQRTTMLVAFIGVVGAALLLFATQLNTPWNAVLFAIPAAMLIVMGVVMRERDALYVGIAFAITAGVVYFASAVWDAWDNAELLWGMIVVIGFGAFRLFGGRR